MRFSDYTRFKRTLDILVSSVGLCLASLPLFCMVGAVKVSSAGPFIFRQIRIGKNGVPFVCYKVRTMRVGTPQRSAAKLCERESYVTPVGSYLRGHSLDEITQLLNVLRGDMSLVGPRPLIPEERELHRLRAENGVYSMRPGLSGLSQINGRNELSDKRKARLDTVYLRNASLWLDLAILGRTLRCLRHKENVTCKQKRKEMRAFS